jgi:hypothetical protein
MVKKINAQKENSCAGYDHVDTTLEKWGDKVGENKNLGGYLIYYIKIENHGAMHAETVGTTNGVDFGDEHRRQVGVHQRGISNRLNVCYVVCPSLTTLLIFSIYLLSVAIMRRVGGQMGPSSLP